VAHERRAILAEVLRVGGEYGPDRVPFDLAVPPATPGEEDHRVLDVHPQMTTVPLSHRLRILRLEEDASEARHAAPMLPLGHGPGMEPRNMSERSNRMRSEGRSGEASRSSLQARGVRGVKPWRGGESRERWEL